MGQSASIAEYRLIGHTLPAVGVYCRYPEDENNVQDKMQQGGDASIEECL
jgi:hypothetical protein